SGPGTSALDWALLTAGFVVAESVVVHITVGRQAHSFAFSEVPFVVGLLFFPATHLITARLAGTAVALLLLRRQALVKVVFNLAQYWLGAVIGISVWQGLKGAGSSGTESLAAV